jgi:hypothetical protein
VDLVDTLLANTRPEGASAQIEQLAKANSKDESKRRGLGRTCGRLCTCTGHEAREDTVLFQRSRYRVRTRI